MDSNIDYENLLPKREINNINKPVMKMVKFESVYSFNEPAKKRRVILNIR